MFEDIYKKFFGKNSANLNDPVVDKIESMDDEPRLIEVMPIEDREPRIIEKIPGKKHKPTIGDEPYVDEVINLDDGFPSDILSLTPNEFLNMCRTYLEESMYKGKCYKNEDFLKNPETGWLQGTDLTYLAKVLDITGVFLSINNTHWNLVLSTDKNEIRTYDPMATRTKNAIRKFDTSDIDIMMLVLSENLRNEYNRQADKMPHYTRKTSNDCTEIGQDITIIDIKDPNFTVKDFLTKMNNGNGYRVSESFIEKLGAPQRNGYDCGPLVLYAAKMSNKEPTILGRY